MVSNNSRQIKIGVSTCLLGQNVRYDGGHKHDRFLTESLGRFVRFVPICPELEVGMGVPREAVNLVGNPETPRMVGNNTGEDWTDRMNEFCKRRVRRKDVQALCGYILKRKSPSCGMERIKIYNEESGMPTGAGQGLFAADLMRAYPYLPVEEEGRLNDPGLRDNFIVRVFALYRWKELNRQPFSRNRMVEFHTRHKYLLLAHNPQMYREMGRLVAAVKEIPPAQFKEQYRDLFMRTLSYRATTRKNVNVLQHIVGFIKKQMSVDEKRDVRQAIEDYHSELVPLIVPITLIRHFIHKYGIDYILAQVYLSPHPKELMLRNHL
ncbi:MAG TPA: DUF523 and DUF1722 domain-containing protein [candidate division Zixibacteria bacterium]|nr:DUF523 and DUF1722 domain-containing protein [candidate division Zixibacteria bacterium]